MFDFKFTTIYYIERYVKKNGIIDAVSGVIVPWTICLSEKKVESNLEEILNNDQSYLYEYRINSMIICD